MENKKILEPSVEKQLKGHRNSITALFFSPNENQIATSSLDNSILLWDVCGSMRSYRFQGHGEAVMDVTFSPSGKYMASASRDKTVRLWVPTVNGSTGMFKAHSQTVRSVQFSPDGNKIVTASDDKIVKLWSSDNYKFLASFVGHTNWVRCARMSSDGSVIASCSDDKSTRLWNPDSGQCIHTFKEQKSHGMYLAWHPTGCYLAVGTSQGNVKLYDVRTHSLVQYYSIHNDAVTQLAFHPSGSYILTSSKDGTMKMLDLLEGHPIFTMSGHNGGINAVNFSPSGDSFASAGDDKHVLLWKTNFTELGNEENENMAQNPSSTNQTSTNKSTRKGSNVWYKCYHSSKYPVVTFVHIDDAHDTTVNQEPVEPYLQSGNLANSTMIDPRPSSVKLPSKTSTPYNSSGRFSDPVVSSSFRYTDNSSNSVGHMSHIPRKPPTQGTYTIPSIINTSLGTIGDDFGEEDIFGMIKLKENDVCYTSGTIEWVGRKRSFPLNSGFKLLNQHNEPLLKKVKTMNATFNLAENGMKDCECADVLPTVHAIVDHLNALHEAVDIVDLRLNTLEYAVNN